MRYKKIFITGGAGYCGARLIPILLSEGYQITVFDKFYFGKECMPKASKNLALIEGDIRDVQLLRNSSKGHDVFISLACISNDASFELDPKLSTSVNLDAFGPMVKCAKDNGIKLFIYASTSSVYGVSDQKNVTEEHPLVPLTLYNDFKGKCEPILFEHTDDDFVGVVFRPATVCGFSPRQRFDVTVNILTNLAVNRGEITVFGGDQLRPNLHILDYCEVLKLFLSSDTNLICNETFNVGYENLSINQIATMVRDTVLSQFDNMTDIKIVRSPSNDPRSYHINSEKIKNKLGFHPKFSIENAIIELCDAFKKKYYRNSLDNEIYYNVKRLKSIQAK